MKNLASELNEFRTLLLKKKIIFAYCGYVTEPILFGLGEALKKKMSLADADKKTVTSVFSIYVEQVQNIIRYSAETDPHNSDNETSLRFGVITIVNENGKFAIDVGNMIKHKDVTRMDDQLSKIAGMDSLELKRAYKAQLKSDPSPDSKGAGLGLLEIARRVSKPLEFDFHKVDDDYTFFALKATI